ncbi:transmembrane protein 70, mitochondrial [Megalops cyprinoides]|uniref:transmembrane protein 70, mitochondrial n=1 Tax=Megalops cyprinoides TaxID=118141 RepID=UPI001863EBA8|nr:transmembrane protein 70, mitochondrial [Megalops cyprinoides]
MLCVSVVRGLQTSFGGQPIFSQFHRIGIGKTSTFRCFNALPKRSGVNTDYACLSLTNEENLLQATRRSLLSNVGINKVRSSSAHKTWRCFSSSSARNSDLGQLIYTGSLGRAVLGVKFFSYSTSMFSLCVMPYLMLQTGLGAQSLAVQVATCGVIGFFTFMSPLLLHLVTKGYVVRLYHRPDTDTYTAITYSALLVEKKTVFHQKEVSVPDVSKMFTSFYANKKPMLVNPFLFTLPHDYNHLMGYDKPFSFEMDELDKPDGSKEA